MFRSFRYRNYRLFFIGQGTSLIGTMMQATAMSWLIYRLTKSAFFLGLFGFLVQLPVVVFTPLAGVLADRLERRRVIIITQILAMAQAVVLTALVFLHVASIQSISLLAIALGVVNAFEMPMRQAFVNEMIEQKDDIGNAIALNSSLFNGARLIGPSLAGLLVAAVGEGWCFLINAVSYLAAIASLAAMRTRPRQFAVHHPHVLAGMKEGLLYAWRNTSIRAILLLVALSSFAGMSFGALMPIFAATVFKGGPRTLGFLGSAVGIGALLGAVYLASKKNPVRFGLILPAAAALFGAGLTAFSLTRIFWLALVFLAIGGFGMMTQMAASNTLLQTMADDDKRGRVMGAHVFAFVGLSTFGSLAAGSLAQHIGAPLTVRLGGACCLIGAAVFAARLPRLRTVTKAS